MAEERDIWGSRTPCFPHQGLLVENEMQAEAVYQGVHCEGSSGGVGAQRAEDNYWNEMGKGKRAPNNSH